MGIGGDRGRFAPQHKRPATKIFVSGHVVLDRCGRSLGYAPRSRTTRHKIGAGMSSQSYRRPEFRLNLGYPEVSLARTGALAPIGVIAPDLPHFIGELRRFGGVVARAHGRLVVVLPEDEVWRGRAVLPGGTRRARHRAALEAGADGLAMPHEAISLVLGTPGPDGTTPLAAVRRGTLTETQALLRHVGIRHAAIVGAGAFPGFATAPRLDVSPLRLPEIDLPDFALLSRLPQLAGALHLPRLTWPKQLPTLIWPPRDRRLLLSAGGAAALTLALLALPGEAPVRTPSAALPPLAAPVEVAAAIDLAPPVVESASPVAPPPLPELLRSERPMARPKTLAAAVPLQPIVTQATRNVPLVSPRRGAPPELRLTELTTARARIPDPSTDAPLRRPVAPASVESPAPAAATAEIRPMHRPKPAAPAPVAAPKLEPTAAAAQPPAAKTVAATTRPLARPEVAPVAASVIPTLVVASLQPEQLIADSIAAAQAAAGNPRADGPPRPPRRSSAENRGEAAAQGGEPAAEGRAAAHAEACGPQPDANARPDTRCHRTRPSGRTGHRSAQGGHPRPGPESRRPAGAGSGAKAHRRPCSCRPQGDGATRSNPGQKDRRRQARRGQAGRRRSPAQTRHRTDRSQPRQRRSPRRLRGRRRSHRAPPPAERQGAEGQRRRPRPGDAGGGDRQRLGAASPAAAATPC